MNQLFWIVPIILGVFLLVACNTSKKGTDNGSQADIFAPQLHDIWVLTHVEGKALAKHMPAPQMELFPGDKRMSGFGGCNQLFGTLEAGASSISFSELGSTKKFCREHMELEQRFMRYLQEADQYTIKNLELVLSKEGENILQFKKID